jgi:cytochrome oxidase Cu insertion factor (SCO1/SenC/PrrC family)
MRSKLLIGALASLAVVSAALATVIVQRIDRPPSETSGKALIGGPFELTDDDGRRVTDESYRGSWMLVYFGYTYCPDICPTGLQTVAQTLDILPEEVAARVTPLFITVDPERDTPALLHDYVELFHPRLIGLSGTVAEIDAVKQAYRVYAKKAGEGDGDDYLVDHSTFTFLMDPEGRYVAHFGHGATAEDIAARINSAVGSTS